MTDVIITHDHTDDRIHLNCVVQHEGTPYNGALIFELCGQDSEITGTLQALETRLGTYRFWELIKSNENWLRQLEDALEKGWEHA